MVSQEGRIAGKGMGPKQQTVWMVVSRIRMFVLGFLLGVYVTRVIQVPMMAHHVDERISSGPPIPHSTLRTKIRKELSIQSQTPKRGKLSASAKATATGMTSSETDSSLKQGRIQFWKERLAEGAPPELQKSQSADRRTGTTDDTEKARKNQAQAKIEPIANSPPPRDAATGDEATSAGVKSEKEEKSTENTSSPETSKNESAIVREKKDQEPARVESGPTSSGLNIASSNEKAARNKKAPEQPKSEEPAPENTFIYEGDSHSEIKDFTPHPKVVIATKIHGPGHVIQLKQSLCLLKAAYNNRVNYDILVFVTEPLSNTDLLHLREIVHPAHLPVEVDEKTLHQHLEAMTQNQTDHLLTRCGVNSTEELFWWTRCCEEGSNGSCMPLSYTWQSEFRAKHIWRSKALVDKKWMMWYDSDAMATRVWKQDPVAFMIRNDLKMLFANFPQGTSAGTDLREKIINAYNGTLCKLNIVDGHFQASPGNCKKPFIPNIHGFFHITNLDFYRNEENLRWADIMIGDAKFSRRWDDQLAVTVPAAMRAPDKSWDMESHGISLDVWHNQFMDGKRRWRGGGFQKWFQVESEKQFPEGVATCKPLVKNSG